MIASSRAGVAAAWRDGIRCSAGSLEVDRRSAAHRQRVGPTIGLSHHARPGAVKPSPACFCHVALTAGWPTTRQLRRCVKPARHSSLNSKSAGQFFALTLQDGDGTSLDIDIRDPDLTRVHANDSLVLPARGDGDAFDHAVFAWNNSTSQMKIYFNNGAPSTVNLPGVTWDANVAMPFTSFFKANPHEPDARRFNGDISLIRIYDTTLSASQVSANFAAGPVIPEPASLALLAAGAVLVGRRRH